MSARNGVATKSRLLTREAILGASDIKIQEIEVPEWGGAVLVRALSVREMGMLSVRQSSEISDGERVDLGVRVILTCVVDEDGRRLLSDDDIDALLDSNGGPVERVAQAVRRLSGITPEQVEALGKNSASAPSGASSSDSPAI